MRGFLASFFVTLCLLNASSANAQSLNAHTDSWYWKISPVEYMTYNEDGGVSFWMSQKSDTYFSSKKDCQQAVALRLKDHPISSNQVIGCYDMGPPVPVNVVTGAPMEGPGTIQTWVWTIEPETASNDGSDLIESTHTFPSEGLCLSDAKAFIKEEALDNDAHIACDMIREKPLGKWSYSLSPLNAVTQDDDGGMRTWSSRIGRNEFESLAVCQTAAQKALKDMAAGWNYVAQCHRSRQNIRPFQIMAPDTRVTFQDQELQAD